MLMILIGTVVLGLCLGSSGSGVGAFFDSLKSLANTNAMLHTIIWEIRFPRVLLAILVGATLSLGGLVFQALLRNPLAEPYILGISGGSAIGAIIGILFSFSRFPGVSGLSFLGGMATLALVLVLSSGKTILRKEALILSGVMVNAFCSAVIMFLVSITSNAKLHSIMFWLMGDLASAGKSEAGLLAIIVIPCFLLVFYLSHSMNLLLMGKETAQALGVNVRLVTVILLVATSYMVSVTVCYCGLVAFVGLVIPHMFRLMIGSDHRVLVPACILGGGAYLVMCDLLARILPRQGEMPAGVITALIGAPVFIYLLKRSR